jgi:tRNA 2-thiouridine synthesizing protein A
LPLLRAKQALRGMSAGALLQVVATDAASVADFAAYARLSGDDLLAFCVQADEFTYWFRKR